MQRGTPHDPSDDDVPSSATGVLGAPPFATSAHSMVAVHVASASISGRCGVQGYFHETNDQRASRSQALAACCRMSVTNTSRSVPLRPSQYPAH
jgi:hypothetical protein